jgi:hypothetical protein
MYSFGYEVACSASASNQALLPCLHASVVPQKSWPSNPATMAISTRMPSPFCQRTLMIKITTMITIIIIIMIIIIIIIIVVEVILIIITKEETMSCRLRKKPPPRLTPPWMHPLQMRASVAATQRLWILLERTCHVLAHLHWGDRVLTSPHSQVM